MKILFFLALLINIVFFLWEVNSGSINNTAMQAGKRPPQSPKQILLVSELEASKNKLDSKNVKGMGAIAVKADDKGGKQPAEITLAKKNDSSVSIEKSGIATNITVQQGHSEKHDTRLNSEPVRDEITHDSGQNPSGNLNDEVDKKRCYEVGPFKNQRALNKWRKTNKISQASVSTVDKKMKLASSYLVYHPAEKTYEASKAIAEVYKQKKISDVWLFRKGDLKGVISFGLFSEEKRALRLQKKLLDTGLNVEILQRFKTETLPYARVLTEDEFFGNNIVFSKKQSIQVCHRLSRITQID